MLPAFEDDRGFAYSLLQPSLVARIEPPGRREAPPDDKLREIRGTAPAFRSAQRGLQFAPASHARSDELHDKLAPVWSGAVLGDVDALPCAEIERACAHRHMQ
jgi:hypothetical protein